MSLFTYITLFKSFGIQGMGVWGKGNVNKNNITIQTCAKKNTIKAKT
jgi:hypothetical protein